MIQASSDEIVHRFAAKFRSTKYAATYTLNDIGILKIIDYLSVTVYKNSAPICKPLQIGELFPDFSEHVHYFLQIGALVYFKTLQIGALG